MLLWHQPLNDQRNIHFKLNRDTADGWQMFSLHRERVMSLLVQPDLRGELALLGAGNCNDVDLSALILKYDHVALVDLDERSLVAAVNRQPVPQPSKLQIRAPVDVGAFAETCPASAHQKLSTEYADALTAIRAKEISEGPFDVVASLCLLTQLILPIAEQLGPQHARCLELVQFERSVHLNLLVEILRPGGRAFLVSDMVSTDTAPELLSMPREQLARTMYRLVAEHNFFTGVNPYLIANELIKDSRFAARVNHVQLCAP